jgi:aminoglycoside phosphotransferase (APT) family kinase protein
METLDGIDAAGVTAWFAEHVPAATAPLTFEMLAGGHSNLTVAVTDARQRRWVLRRPPLSARLATAHDVGREHRVMAALEDTDVPVPVMRGYCDDDTVTGAPFFVMDHVEGHVLHDVAAVEAHLPVAARPHAAEHAIDVLAALHAVDPDAVGLGDLGRREGYVQRQLRRWATQWDKTRTRDLPVVERVHARLEQEVPDQGPAGIVHGDFRFGNMLITPQGDCAAVLDLELCTLGDPLADLGWFLHYWELPEDEGGVNETAPSRAGGFPPREELIARYAERSGRDLSRLAYYRAFAAWRLACIIEGVYSRYQRGALGEPPPEMEAFRLTVERNAEQAERLLG